MKKLVLLVLLILVSGCVQEEDFIEEKNLGGEKMAKMLFVIAPKNFKDEEYFTPKKILEKNNVEVVTASTTNEAVSVNGKRQEVDVLLDKAGTVDYDGIVFIGGPGASVYLNDEKAINLAKKFFENNKLVAAICIAPSILANAGILNGKKTTVFPSERRNLENNGAIYTGESVEVDGNIITANGPDASKEFGEKILEKLK